MQKVEAVKVIKKRVAWNKGLKNVQEPYWLGKKRPEVNTWLKPHQFQKGLEVWNKGLKGIHLSPSTEFTSESMAGDKHWNWQGGITPEMVALRNKFNREMKRLIFERDDYTCQICGNRNRKGNGKTVLLHVDHIQSWSDNDELRFSEENCRTLCIPCHYFVTFGKTIPVGSKWGNMYKKEDS